MKFHGILINLIIVFVCGFTSTGLAINSDSSQLIIISDVDDTLKETNLHPGVRIDLFIRNVLSSSRSFIGMDLLFSAFANKRAQFYYVSGAIKPIGFLPRKFLQVSSFPPGELVLREQLSESQIDFKFRAIKKIISTNPQAKFVILGDNGEYDVDVFKRLTLDPDIKNTDRIYFVHRVFDEPVGTSIPNPLESYVTSADLALKLYDMGVFSKNELITLINIVISGLESKFSSVRDRTLPFYNKLQNFDMLPLYNRLEFERDPELKSKFEKLFDLILERKKGNSCNINISF